MGCPPILRLTQRTGELGETEEEMNRETHHRVQHLHVSEEGASDSASSESILEDSLMDLGQRQEPAAERQESSDSVCRPRVKWPCSKSKEWSKLDDDLDNVLEVVLAGNVDKKIEAMTEVVYRMGLDRFGPDEKNKGGKVAHDSNRRTRLITSIRAELRQLRKQYRRANPDEKAGLAELTDSLRERLSSLRKAERYRKNRRERARKRASFIKNPYGFMKKMLGDKRTGRLSCPRAEVEEHLKAVHSDPDREVPLGIHPKLISPEEPEKPMDDSEPRLKEVMDIIKNARAGSAPGPNGIPYKVYKNCPKLTKRLWRLIRVVWRRGALPDCWLVADGCFIPKEEESVKLNQFRTISLLNVEGKICLAVLAKRLVNFLLENKYMDTSVQKGGVPGVPGCLEHTSVLTKIIQDAKDTKGDLTVLWLDLANAYGSIPHQLVDLTLERYHVPEKFRIILQHYFNNFKMRFNVDDYTTSWQRLEVGIVTGCTISVVLFSAAMNLIVKSAEKMSRGPVLATGVRQPPTRAFMDDMTITAKSVPEGRWMLEDIGELVQWARMKFKPAKSRSLVLKKGKVQNRFRFKLGEEVIPTISEKPVKSLGKWFRDTLNDRDSVKEMKEKAREWTETIDKSGLPGKYKAWCYQHGILPRILWPLLIYEVPMTAVEELERIFNRFLRRWLGVPRSFTSIGLYSSGSKLQMPLTAVTEEFKVTKARQVMTLRDSKDEKVSKAGIKVRTGRKWTAEAAVEQAESRLRHKDIVGTVAMGRLGIGNLERPNWEKASTRERREMVQKEVRAAEEESRQTKAVGMKQQGAWTRWEEALPKKLSWGDIWKMDQHKISFLLKSVYDVLPSPTNLRTWGLTDDPSCKLCGKPANLEHVLASCSTALTDGRYTWRHDQVLAEIAAAIDIRRRAKQNNSPKQSYISFVASGAGKPTKTRYDASGLLGSASDWEMQADIKTRAHFPPEIVTTALRPDIVLWSKSTKQVAIVELTVPWETRMDEAHQRKLCKYEALVDECRQNGWKARQFAVEVGCRGFAAQSLWQALGALGINGAKRKALITAVSRKAEDASNWLWRKREEKWRS